MSVNWVDFWSVVSWIVYGPGAGTIAWIIMNKVPWKYPCPEGEKKRYISIALSVVIAVAFWGVLISGGKTSAPAGDFWAWWIEIWKVGGVAFIAASAIHGATNLRANDKAVCKAIQLQQENAQWDAMTK